MKKFLNLKNFLSMKTFLKVTAVVLSSILLIQVMVPGTLEISKNISVAVLNAGAPLTAEEAGAAAVGDTYVKENRIEEPVEILGEDETQRTENTKLFINEDKSSTIALYPVPVHFLAANGLWQDIDNTLSLNSDKRSATGKAAYTPAASGMDIRVPQEFTQGQMLTVGKDGYTVGLGVSARSPWKKAAARTSTTWWTTATLPMRRQHIGP